MTRFVHDMFDGRINSTDTFVLLSSFANIIIVAPTLHFSTDN